MTPLSEKQQTAFWAKVAKAGPDDCWPWIGCVDTLGYGRFSMKKEDGKFTKALAHRVVAFLSGIAIDALGVFHRCDNPPCCNSRHLFVGVQADNIADMVAKGRSADVEGQRNPRAKLTNRKVLNIRHRIARGDQIASIARDYGCGWTTISHIKNGDTWSHVK